MTNLKRLLWFRLVRLRNRRKWVDKVGKRCEIAHLWESRMGALAPYGPSRPVTARTRPIHRVTNFAHVTAIVRRAILHLLSNEAGGP